MARINERIVHLTSVQHLIDVSLYHFTLRAHQHHPITFALIYEQTQMKVRTTPAHSYSQCIL